MGRPGRDVPHARPARVPAPARRHRARGHRARAGRRGGRAAAGGLPRHARSRTSASASGSCSAGPGLRGAVPVVLATFPVIAEVPRSRELFNIVFFAVLVSTLLQGTTFEPLAARLGATTSEPALPRPLAEGGTIRRLGAEILEYPIAADDAIVGHRVRDLGLPRDAVVNVIVRDDQAIPPRGTTRSARRRPPPRPDPPGERARALRHPRPLALRPDRPPAAAARRAARPRGGVLHRRLARAGRRRRAPDGGRRPRVIEHCASAATSRAACGARGRPLRGHRARCMRWGRAAAVSDWARRRMRQAEADERAWLQTVIGALAADLPE